MAPIRPTPRHADYIWQNGEFVPWDNATVHLSAMGASAGVAVFEGIKGYWNPETETINIIRLDHHLQRLAQSMRMMRMQSEFDVSALAEATIELCRENRLQADTYLRPVVYYSGAEHGSFGDTVGDVADVIISTKPFTTILGTHRGYSAKVSS
ncbi:MAG TPA: aminotransferase class IV, partial [Chloroflexota bacterium]|nr:aminotransferase class IV [Chloroflexota bacterium]